MQACFRVGKSRSRSRQHFFLLGCYLIQNIFFFSHDAFDAFQYNKDFKVSKDVSVS